MARNEDSQARWLTRPLCRRYVVSVFESATVQCRDGGAVRRLEVEWAFGWLSDGECEPLGVWIKSEPERDYEAALTADLKRRGVEWLWAVIGCKHEHLVAAFMSRTPRTSVERILAQAQGASERRGLPFPTLITEQIRESVNRAVRRHGAFDSHATALDFIAIALQRAERRLDRDRLAAIRGRRLESSAAAALLTV